MPTVMVPGVMVIEDAIVVTSKSVVHRSGSSTIIGVAPLPGVKASTATVTAPESTSQVMKPK